MSPLIRHQAWLVLLAVLIFFTNLGNYTLFNDDETKNTVCATEMFRRGDIIVPTFYEELRTDKPILLYWFMLTSFKFWGISEFSARFASALLSVGTTLLTYHLGRKLYSANIGFLAGVIVCSCGLFSAVGRAATPDSPLIFFVTLAFTAFVWAVAWQRQGNFSGDPELADEAAADATSEASAEEGPPEEAISEETKPTVAMSDLPTPTSWKLAAPFYAAMGFAVLAKGPVGLVLPTVIVLLFMLITLLERDRQLGKLKATEGPWWRRFLSTVIQILRPEAILEAVRSTHLLIGLGIVAAVALPWYLTVGIKTDWAWPRGFLLDHNVGRALSPKENHNGFPFYMAYQLVALHFGCFPWSVFLPVAAYQMRERLKFGAPWRDSDRLVACWAGVWFVFFSIVSTRLPNYLLPMYPAAALLLARYFHDWKSEPVDSGVYSFNICCRAMGIVGILTVIGVYIAAFLLFDGETWLSLIPIIPVIGAFIAVKFLDREQRTRVLQTLMATGLLFAFLIVGVAPPSVSRHQDTPKFIADAKRFAGSDEFEIGTYKYFQPSVLYYAGKKIPVFKSTQEVADFIASHPHAFVITRPSELNELRNDLPGDASELSRHRNFLERDELILVGRRY